MNNILYSKPAIQFKRIIVEMITSPIISKFIRRVYNNKLPYFSTTIYTDNVAIENRIIGLLFLKAYESCEIRYINEYMLHDYPVVELGSSLGVITMQIAKSTTSKVYSVEANPFLIPIIKNNLKKHDFKLCGL